MAAPIFQGFFPRQSQSYKLLHQIADGHSTAVYKAVCIPLNAVVAVKIIDYYKCRPGFFSLRPEAIALSHPNILTPHCSFVDGHSVWVVLPFLPRGSLRSIIPRGFSGGLSEPCIAAVLHGVLTALSFLHDQGHFHGDVKPGNILIRSDGAVALADFGASASNYELVVDSDSPSSSSASSDLSSCAPYWLAPEVMQSPATGYSPKADIWSVAVTALELAHGRPPLSYLPPLEPLILKMMRRFWFSVYPNQRNDNNFCCDFLLYFKRNSFSDAFKVMVSSCLRYTPSLRPSAQELLTHPFFKNCQGPDFLDNKFLPPTHDNTGLVLKDIIGWTFDRDGLELSPVFKSGEETEVEMEMAESRVGEEMMQVDGSGNIQAGVMENVPEAGESDKEKALRLMLEIRRNLDVQRKQVNIMIGKVSGADNYDEDEVDKIWDQLELLRSRIAAAAAAFVLPPRHSN